MTALKAAQDEEKKQTNQGRSTPFSPIKKKKKKKTANKRKKWLCSEEKRACLVFLFPKILILRFHMWSLDLLPVTGGMCCGRLQAAERTTRREERGASRRGGRASPLQQPLAGVRRTRRRWMRLPGAPQPLLLACSSAVLPRQGERTSLTRTRLPTPRPRRRNHHKSPQKRWQFFWGAKLSSVGDQVRAGPPPQKKKTIHEP